MIIHYCHFYISLFIIFMEDIKAILNYFESVVNGMHRPHLYGDTFIPEKKRSQIAFEGLVDENENIQVDGLSDLFRDGDKIRLEIADNQPVDDAVKLVISDVQEDWKDSQTDIDITPTFNEKSEFYYDYLLTAYTVTCSRIEKQLSTLSTAEFKQSFPDGLVLYIMNLIGTLDEYEHTLKYDEKNDSDRANVWTISSARIYLIRLLAFVCQTYKGFCTFKIWTPEQWKDELYPYQASMRKQLFSAINKKYSKNKTVESPTEIAPPALTSFGLNGNQQKLLEALKALQLKLPMNLIDEAQSSIDDLYKILTATDLSQGFSPIHFSCETNQIAYILRKFKDSFNSLNEDNIELSGLFLTRNGTILTKGNIKKAISSCKNDPKERVEIDKAIADFIKKS